MLAFAAVRARSRRWAARTPGWRALALRQARYSCRRRARTVWFGWSEPPMVKVRNGPNCASIGLAQEALVGVKQSSALFFSPRCGSAGSYWRTGCRG